MIRNLDPSAERFLLDLGRIQQAIGRASQQISSGLKVTAPSDSPDQISDILQLYVDIERNAQLRTNLERVNSETATAEASLGSAVRLVERARVLAAQGVTSTQTAGTRRIMAGEVQALLEQLVGASRTMVQNRYVFSGDQDQAPAYQVNLASPEGVDRLATPSATRGIQHPSGTSFTVAKTAGEIFDRRNPDDSPASDNVFAAVNSLRLALENDDQAGIGLSLAALRAAADRLNVELSYYGAVQNKLAEAIDMSHRLEAHFKMELSSRRDADITEAILELQRSRTHEEATYGARSQMPRSSLFDFL